MCGFVVACHHQAPVPTVTLDAALDTLRHRGPDGRASWLSADGLCGIGFHRLAMVGAREQTQPFHTDDVHVVVNGEIYQYAAQRQKLEAAGACFATDSDCEVVAHGYLQLGIDYVRELNGEFAGVIWDARRRKLFAIRDRWGVKPLFYRLSDQGIHLASEIKALIALGAQPRWDHAALFQHFFASIGPAQTLFEGIHQVPPGHVLEWSTQGYGVTPLLSAVDEAHDAARQHLASAPREWMPRLVDGLRHAVQDRFQGDGPVACYLSGGVDSATVAALAARHGREGLSAFTVDFGAGTDDATQAAGIAASLGLRHEVVPVSEAQLVDHFADAVRHAETIGFNTIGAARWILGRVLASSGYKAVLAGDGADELFAGYSFSSVERLCARSHNHARLMTQVLEGGRQGLAAELGQPLPLFDMDPDRFGGQVPYLLASWNYQRSGLRPLLRTQFLEAFRHFNPYEVLMQQTGASAASGLRRSLHLWQKSMFANHILVSERFDMAHGIETRYPFLDNRVTAVAAMLPDEWLVEGAENKRFLREAVAALTPEAARCAAKRPFEAPAVFAQPGDGPFRRYLREVLHDSSVKHSGIFDVQELLRLEARLPSLSGKMAQRVDSLLTMALSFFVLQQCFAVTE
ncbi:MULTISPECIES: asparagine synthase (glutamine-hydrolyzing) [Pseudomonas]|uniref:asparagine synthase (glutamine-hydrolyzing) n=3 Tax=Pseudomonas TaxID=286 RepID=A0A0N9X1F0_PSEFL|nr:MULTISPECIES: asparagine synthase (glutamine-hydrolyzing) [Pseudomonas]ALI10216.1 asparagine synthase [Pseudomonas fluorescens]